MRSDITPTTTRHMPMLYMVLPSARRRLIRRRPGRWLNRDVFMLGYSKILCALDFDEHATSTLRVAGALAKESNATLDILHIARIPARDMDVPLPFDPDPIWEKEAREGIEKLIQGSSIGEIGRASG